MCGSACRLLRGQRGHTERQVIAATESKLLFLPAHQGAQRQSLAAPHGLVHLQVSVDNFSENRKGSVWVLHCLYLFDELDQVVITCQHESINHDASLATRLNS